MHRASRLVSHLIQGSGNPQPLGFFSSSTAGHSGGESAKHEKKDKRVRVTKVFTNANGDSEFGSFEVNMADNGPIGFLSKTMPTTGIILRETPSSYNFDWHPAPRRQFIVNLDAPVKITTSVGQERVFGIGEVFFVEDTTGKGHKSQAVAGQTRRSVFIPVPDSFNSNTTH